MECYGGYTSNLFNKDADNMMPFSKTSVWKFADINDEFKVTTKPSVTGTSVLGVVFDKGVMICADVLGSYGSLARFFDAKRVLKVNDQTILGASGDYADFQFVSSVIEQHVIDEECLNDGFNLKPKGLHCWLTRTLYNRRSKFDPLWNVFVVGGMQDGKPYLGVVDKIGTSFESPTIATGYGAYLAQPLMRSALEKNPSLNEQEAKELLVHCLRVLFYRDSKAYHKYTLATCTAEGAKVEGPFEITTDWHVGLLIHGYE